MKYPIKIISEMNCRDNWRKKASRTKEHRALGKAIMRGKFSAVKLPTTVYLVRIGIRELDDDNLTSGFKAFRDGIADGLGVTDNHPQLSFVYLQKKGAPKEYAVEVHFNAYPYN